MYNKMNESEKEAIISMAPLPEEIIIKIFLFMSPKELNRLRQVCKAIGYDNQEYIWKVKTTLLH